MFGGNHESQFNQCLSCLVIVVHLIFNCCLLYSFRGNNSAENVVSYPCILYIVYINLYLAVSTVLYNASNIYEILYMVPISLFILIFSNSFCPVSLAVTRFVYLNFFFLQYTVMTFTVYLYITCFTKDFWILCKSESHHL